MPDKPIIFSAPMIRALLDGRKTQTRRVLKPQPDASSAVFNGVFGVTDYASFAPRGGGESQLIRLSYAPGDRLWVKERAAWVSGKGWRYMADNDDLTDEYEMGEVGKWCSPIHMRRRASRCSD